MQPDPRVLDELVQRIVEVAKPLRIILFGSAARGEMWSDSDLDILVVMPDGVHRRRVAQDLHQRMFGLPISVDILVATPTDLRLHKDNVGLIYYQVTREGKEIYAA